MPRSTALRAALVAVALATVGTGLVGCTPGAAKPTASASPPATEQVAPGDIPDTQAYVTARAPSGHWELKVPEGWAQRTTPHGFAFTDKLNTVAADERTAASAPTVDGVKASEVPALRAAHTGVVVTSVGGFQRRGGSGVLLRYRFDSPKDPVTGKVHRAAAEEYLFFHAGREVAVTLSGAVGADNVDPWRMVTDGFRWLP